ncbi:MAG: thioesterase family protein [Clostridia bacterium]|nr:thioesterase family protein [Clostridia bacterium]
MDKFGLDIGLKASIDMKVSGKDTAQAVGSGGIDVFSTPTMIALMEKAALSAVEPHLPAGYATVGTMVNIKHIAATPVEMEVNAVAELIAVDDKKLTFKIEAYDSMEKIGEGLHERYIVNTEKFRDKVYSKGK